MACITYRTNEATRYVIAIRDWEQEERQAGEGVGVGGAGGAEDDSRGQTALQALYPHVETKGRTRESECSFSAWAVAIYVGSVEFFGDFPDV